MPNSAPLDPLGFISSTSSLIKFALPSVVTMAFMGLYTIADVIFVAHFVSSDAMASINIACPIINIIVGFATMLATGGNAIVASKLGEGCEVEARRDFSLIMTFGTAASIIIAVAGNALLRPLSTALGATDVLMPYCMDYLAVILTFAPACILQVLLQNSVIAAGRPDVGTAMAIICGITNIVLDYLFLGILDMGITGAAWGTSMGYVIATAIGLIFFLTRKQGLRFSIPSSSLGVLWHSCTNGISEMVGQTAAAVTTFLFNSVMLGLAGEDGVAAVTVLIYSQFLISSVFFGFSMGCAPVISYNYGTNDSPRLQKVFRSCIRCIVATSLLLCALAFTLAPLLASLFAPDDSTMYVMTSEGLTLFSLAYLFAGMNIFASSSFTALGNGGLSALIASLRTFGLVPLGLLLLPKILGLQGVWIAVPVAEIITFFVAIALIAANRKRYGY